MSSANHSQADTGVAAGGFHNNSVGFDLAGCFGGADHGDGDAVFHAAAWIEVFQLGGYFAGQAFGEAVEVNQRGVAD